MIKQMISQRDYQGLRINLILLFPECFKIV